MTVSASYTELDIKKLMATAEEITKLSDYGDNNFIKPFEAHLHCVVQDANLTEQGLAEFKDELVRHLVNRLRFQRDLKQHPEILNENVSDPIIILGLPRSGTTKTHRMLGQDPELLKPYLWQLMNPAPFADTISGKMDSRMSTANLGDSTFDGGSDMNPMHHFDTGGIDEDWLLFNLTFNDMQMCLRAPSFEFEDWLLSRTEPSDLDNYRYVHSLFQYLQWQQGGRKNRRWVMKHCGHFAYLEQLLTVYPNATLVHVHRHPYECIPSFAKLMYVVRGMREVDVEPKEVCEHLFKWAKIVIERYLQDRDRLNLNERIFDVQYDQIRDDPMPVFREVYQRAGLTLSAEAEEKMLQWEKENEQGKHGNNPYTLEEFGLTKEKIDDAFGDYIQRFIKK